MGGGNTRAAERFEAARRVAVPISEADPTDLRLLAIVAEIHEGLGRCTSGNQSAEWFTKSVALWREWKVAGRSIDYGVEHLQAAQRLLAAVQ